MFDWWPGCRLPAGWPRLVIFPADELADHAMPPVHAGTTVGKNIANHLSKFNGGIKLSIGEQTGVSSDLGPVELKLESTVKIDPKAPLFRFTHRVCHIR